MSDAVMNEEVTQADLVAYITAATYDVFATMLGQEVTAGACFVEAAATSPASGIVSLVGLAGSWIGTGSICCTAALACRISSSFLMTEYDSVTEEVLDSVAEITNMIIGNVKTALEERLGPLGLSIPTVIFGRNFQTRNAGNHKWIVVPFQCGKDSMHVQLCLLPHRETGTRTVRAGFPVPHIVGF